MCVWRRGCIAVSFLCPACLYFLRSLSPLFLSCLRELFEEVRECALTPQPTVHMDLRLSSSLFHHNSPFFFSLRQFSLYPVSPFLFEPVALCLLCSCTVKLLDSPILAGVLFISALLCPLSSRSLISSRSLLSLSPLSNTVSVSNHVGLLHLSHFMWPSA